ncbi:MAG: EF-hand domain-containing protein [Pseudomonadota bacterium]|nr:EF-hand domain-containing protein [Pseudomonadota bacterium]
MNDSKMFAPILTATVLALAAPLAFAQDAQSPPQTQTEAAQHDTAASQPTAQAEAGQAKAATWDDIDTDGNGTISKQEAAVAPRLAEIFDEADVNKDGELTANEYKAYLAANGSSQPKPTNEGG